jgi:hypothetical protein
MRPILVAAFILFLILSAAGCARSPGGIAPSNIPLQQGGYTPIGPVSASDCKVNLLGILPLSGGNQIADAMQSALRRESSADALVDISIDHVWKYFILWSSSCTEIRATAVRIP